MKRPRWAWIGLLAMTVSGLSAQTVTEYSRQTPPDYKYSNTRFGNYPGDYFAPRIEWGRPLAAGPLNLLVVLHTQAAREAVELVSRFDARVDVVAASGNGGFSTWAFGARGEGQWYGDIPSRQALNDRATILLSPAYRHHAIIIGRLMWTTIPGEIRSQILDKVKAGTALIFVTPWAVDDTLLKLMGMTADNPLAETIRKTVPLDALPLEVTIAPPAGSKGKEIKMGPFEVQTGRLGEGRVVFVQYNDFQHYPVLQAGEEPKTGGQEARKEGGARPLRVYNAPEDNTFTPLALFAGNDDLFYNYYFSILAKAIVHAAGRESGMRVAPDSVHTTVKRAVLPSAPVMFKVSGTKEIPAETSVYYEIRDRQNRVVAQGEKEIVQKDGEISFTPAFPVLKQGLYIVDAWLKRRGMTLDWASAAVTVTDTAYLASVAADKEYFGRDEGISGNLTLSQPLPRKLKVVVELWDTYSRLEQRVKLKAGETKFSFNRILYPLSRTYRIMAKVESGEAVLDEQETWTGLPSNEFDEFQFVTWDAACGGRGAQIRLHLLKEFGLTGYFDMASYMVREELMTSADILARNNLTAWPLCYGIWGWSPRRYGDLLKGEWKETFRRVYLDRTAAYKRYGTLAYSIDSESELEADDAAWDIPIGREDYRRYLKERYGDIAHLNQIWGAAFASFDDIGFISFQDAKAGRQPTRWLEQRLYKVDRFNLAAEHAAGLVREFDPGARIGHDIACAPCHGSFDIPRMTKVIDAFIQSSIEHFDKENKNRIGSGYWFGFYQNEQGEWQMRTKPWESLFQGGSAIAWWPGINTFTPDLCEPYLCFKQACEEIQDIHSGINRLLMSADKRVDPILILWSYNSWMAGIYYPQETGWYNSVDNFINLLRRTGLDYQCIGEDFIQDKLQFGDRQRVLILPASQSIALRTVDKIKAFAAAGGLVIADMKPAVMDEYLKPYGEDKAKSGGEVKFETCPKCQGKKIIHLGGAGDPLGNCPTCGGTGTVVKGGAAVPEKSALDELFDFAQKGVRPYGKGCGFYLKGAPPRDEWRAFRTMLVEKGGVKGDLEVLDTLGNTRTDLRTYVFDSGPAMFVGVLPDKTITDPPGEEFILKTAQKMHVYNVRMHSYLGYTDAVPAGILPAQAKLFALLPARIEGLTVAVNRKACRPGEVVTLDIRTMPDALKDVSLAVRVEVLKDGKAISAYTKKLAVKGSASLHLPLALNQAKGEYILRLTEVVSGQRQEITIGVR